MAITLPTEFEDEDTWGSELNEFLLVAHNADGTDKSAIFSDDIRSQGAVADDVGSASDNVAAFVAAFAAYNSATIPVGTFYVDAPIVVPTGCTLRGAGLYTSILRLTAGAANDTEIVHCQSSNVQMHDFTIYGNWNAVTSGLLGEGVKIEHTDGSTAIENFALSNIRILLCKGRAVHAHNVTNLTFLNVNGNSCGLDGLYLEGDSDSVPCSTISLLGSTEFSTTPNGYSIRLKNTKNAYFQYKTTATKGVLVTGDSNGNLTFENSTYGVGVTNVDYVFDLGTSSGEGLAIINCDISQIVNTSVVRGVSGWTKCVAKQNTNDSGVDFLDDYEEIWTFIEQGDVVLRANKLKLEDEILSYNNDTLFSEGSLTTSDATPGTLFSIDFDTDQATYVVEYTITGCTTSGSPVGGSWRGHATILMDTGSILGEETVEHQSGSSLDMSLDLSLTSEGATLSFEVTGMDAEMDWHGKFAVSQN